MRLFAVAAPGLEETVATEIRALRAADVRVVPGGVEWNGDLESLYAANLWSRVATRVYLRVGEVKAHDFAALRRGVAGLEWERWIRPGAKVEVKAAARKCRLYHTGGIAERVLGGIADRLPGLGSGSAAEVLARGAHDVFTLSVDTSGDLLHKRGYRGEQGEAPLRETLAAGMLALAGWDASMPLLDPMCGSGTIVIEAALIASGIAPGANRHFAFESWPSHDPALWSRLQSQPSPVTPAPAIFASDRDPEAIDVARRNAVRAGIDNSIHFEQTKVRDLHVPSSPAGLVITNPPYGKRISGSPRELSMLWRSLPGWRLAVITPDRNLPAAIRSQPLAKHPLVNGGLRVTLFVFGPTRR